MKKYIFSILLLILAVPASAECLNPEHLARLKTEQLDYFKTKFPPAFRHAYQDGKIKLDYTTAVADQAGSCKVDLMVGFPQDDLDLANAEVDKVPAKKIMLSAQGYAMPEKNALQATFTVDTQSPSIPSQGYLQTTSLGQLTTQLELIYALVTQARIEAIGLTAPASAWDSASIKLAESKCQQLVTKRPVDCTCKIQKLSQKIGFREWEYIDSAQNNPYAFATSAGAAIGNIMAPMDQACSR